MTPTLTKNTPSIQYPPLTIQRAQRALSCSPFKIKLFTDMINASLPLSAMTSRVGVQQNYTKQSLSEIRVESELMWLIQVGLLRREVDGQGITDSFRLTPLGKQIIQQWQNQGGNIPQPSLWDRLRNQFYRWVGWLFS
jgi:hypothetical protein